MTEEQLNALENWIVAIIREEDPASGVPEVIDRIREREAVEVIFGLREKGQ